MKTTQPSPRLLTLVGLIALVVAGCRTNDPASRASASGTSATGAIPVYVADFDLGSQTLQHEGGVLSGRPGPVGRVGDRLSGATTDPATRARQLVELMSDSIVKDLTKAGVSAHRVTDGTPLPSRGWLVRGVFTEVDEGNRLRRALIGFGQGPTDVQVVTTVHDLAEGPPQPLYEIAAEAGSGSKPGAAPTLVLGPYGAAARFVMAGNDLEKNVRQAAAQIADRLAKRLGESP